MDVELQKAYIAKYQQSQDSVIFDRLFNKFKGMFGLELKTLVKPWGVDLADAYQELRIFTHTALLSYDTKQNTVPATHVYNVVHRQTCEQYHRMMTMKRKVHLIPYVPLAVLHNQFGKRWVVFRKKKYRAGNCLLDRRSLSDCLGIEVVEDFHYDLDTVDAMVMTGLFNGYTTKDIAATIGISQANISCIRASIRTGKKRERRRRKISTSKCKI